MRNNISFKSRNSIIYLHNGHRGHGVSKMAINSSIDYLAWLSLPFLLGSCRPADPASMAGLAGSRIVYLLVWPNWKLLGQYGHFVGIYMLFLKAYAIKLRVRPFCRTFMIAMPLVGVGSPDSRDSRIVGLIPVQLQCIEGFLLSSQEYKPWIFAC